MFDEHVLRDVYDNFIKTGTSVSGSNYVSFEKFSVPVKLVAAPRMPQREYIYKSGTAEDKKYNLLLFMDHIHGPTLFYKREILLKYLQKLADAKMVYTEDLVPWLMSFYEEPITFFDRTTIVYERGVGFVNRGGDIKRDQESFFRYLTDEVFSLYPASKFAKNFTMWRALGNKCKEHPTIFNRLCRIIILVLSVPKIYFRYIRNKFAHKVFTRTDLPTDFANLCMTRE